MLPYVAHDVFTPRDIELYHRAQEIVARIPSKQPDGQWVRCHEVARLVGRMLQLPVFDGRCGPMEHSWLRTPDGASLDVYAPGRLPPVQLVDTKAPWAVTCYPKGPTRTDIREQIVTWLGQELQKNLQAGRHYVE